MFQESLVGHPLSKQSTQSPLGRSLNQFILANWTVVYSMHLGLDSSSVFVWRFLYSPLKRGEAAPQISHQYAMDSIPRERCGVLSSDRPLLVPKGV